eukprot:3201096-Rhodomonas_salina.1
MSSDVRVCAGRQRRLLARWSRCADVCRHPLGLIARVDRSRECARLMQRGGAGGEGCQRRREDRRHQSRRDQGSVGVQTSPSPTHARTHARGPCAAHAPPSTRRPPPPR